MQKKSSQRSKIFASDKERNTMKKGLDIFDNSPIPDDKFFVQKALY